VSTSPVFSACWRLMHHDVKINGARIRAHDLWIISHKWKMAAAKSELQLSQLVKIPMAIPLWCNRLSEIQYGGSQIGNILYISLWIRLNPHSNGYTHICDDGGMKYVSFSTAWCYRKSDIQYNGRISSYPSPQIRLNAISYGYAHVCDGELKYVSLHSEIQHDGCNHVF